jgi:putative Mg2+ transporter-C (MgtC) family protein
MRGISSHLTLRDVLFRILAAALAGALIGMERETHGRPAGLRTTILTCVASALAMVVSEILFTEAGTVVPGGWRPDPGRLGAGILTGIGFLGGGAILRQDNLVRGVTTAATLWFVTVLGLAFGTGLFMIGGLGVLIALFTLLLLPYVEKLIPTDWFSTLKVTTQVDALTATELALRLKALGLRVERLGLSYDAATQHETISCDVKVDRRHVQALSQRAVLELRKHPGVLKVQWG